MPGDFPVAPVVVASSMDYLRGVQERCDPYFINNQIYFVSGFGWLNSSARWKNVLYVMYRSYCYFAMTLTFLVQMVDVYLLMNDFVKLAEDLCAILVTFVVVIKMYVVAFRMERLESLYEDFLCFRRSRTHPEEERIWSKASRMIYRMTETFYALGTPCVVFWIFFPAMDDSSTGRQLPYPWVFFVDQYQTPYYEIIYVFQSVALFSFLVNILSVDLGYSSFVVLLAAQHEILSRDIAVIGSMYDTGESVCRSGRTEETVKRLKQVVKVHNNVMRQLGKFQGIYRDLFFLQISLTALMIAMVVVDTIINSRGLSLRVFQRVLYTASAFFDTFMLCYCGSHLREKGEEFATSIYNCNWVEMDNKVRKMLLFMMMKAQGTPKLKNVMYTFDLPLFLDISRLAYNGAALLQNTA